MMHSTVFKARCTAYLDRSLTWTFATVLYESACPHTAVLLHSAQADKDSPLRADAQHRLMEAQLHVADAKHWFWWFNTEQRSIVRKQQKLEAAAAERLAGLQREQARLLSDAKSELGLWSEVRPGH